MIKESDMKVGDIVRYNGFIAKIVQEVGSGVLISYVEEGKALATVAKVSKESLTTTGEK